MKDHVNSMNTIELLTLNARDNVLLEVSRDYFAIGPRAMQTTIRESLAQTVDILASKDINYDDLKSALVPNTKRREVSLVFDTTNMQESWYGLPIYRAIIPLLNKNSSHSILSGDYIGQNSAQNALRDAFHDSVQLARDVTWHHSTQFYIVYINNLSDNMFSILHDGLIHFEPYVGFADMTFASRFKLNLSTMLVNNCIKHKNTIIMGHEDDVDNKHDFNVRGYPWEDFGYTCRSLQGMYFGLFLSYKIERPVIQGFESDTEFSINAVNPDPLPVGDLEIRIDEKKFGYLARKKAGTLKRMGLPSDDVSKLRRTIADRISSNYIYNMKYDASHGITTFNLVLEIHFTSRYPQRVVASMEYVPDDRYLRLITLY